MTPLGFPRPVTVCIDEARYWQGLGRQEMDFHQVLGELVDNSISASGFDKDGDLLPFTVEITIQRIGNKVRVKVADEGTGMSLSDLEKNVISPGGKGSAEGPLNEHGFGLKNALCMLSLGNERPFKIQTRDKKAVRQGHYYLVDSPFSSGMLIKLDKQSNWNTNLKHATGEIGTRIYAETSYEYFRTLYPRGKGFEAPLVVRLGEHLGVMYRGFLGNSSNKMWLRWQDLGDDEETHGTSEPWHEKRIVHIDIPYDIGAITEREIPIILSGVTAKAIYRFGTLDKEKARDTTRGWPFPLQIYYQANTRTQGIDISVKKRIVKTGQLDEIWWDVARDNHYNYFTGELFLDNKFTTVNNKIALDPNNPFWQALVAKLNKDEPLSPSKQARVYTEKIVKEKLKTILEGTISGSKVYADRPVWTGSGVKIDLYHHKPTGIEVYEVKPDTAGPVDVYQLLMYWDGVVVDERKSPELGRLVAKEAPPSVNNIIAELNKRKDALGNPYKFEFKEIAAFGITA